MVTYYEARAVILANPRGRGVLAGESAKQRVRTNSLGCESLRTRSSRAG